MSAKIAQKALKKATKNLAKNASKSAGKQEAKMRTRPSHGVIPKAVASEGFDIMAGLDTSNVPGGNVESRLLALQEYGRPSFAVAPRSEALQSLTSGMRGAQRSLQGSPASLLFPDSLTEYLEAVNSPLEKPTNKQRIMGLLDFF